MRPAPARCCSSSRASGATTRTTAPSPSSDLARPLRRRHSTSRPPDARRHRRQRHHPRRIRARHHTAAHYASLDHHGRAAAVIGTGLLHIRRAANPRSGPPHARCRRRHPFRSSLSTSRPPLDPSPAQRPQVRPRPGHRRCRSGRDLGRQGTSTHRPRAWTQRAEGAHRSKAAVRQDQRAAPLPEQAVETAPHRADAWMRPLRAEADRIHRSW